MHRILARKSPETFKTLPLHVEANERGLSYQTVGTPLNFAQMLERRRPLALEDHQRFVLELANLGVSVRLTLDWQGRDYWLLVRQRRADRGDCVLKLISGYVPAHELHLPLHTALQEVAEECLVRIGDRWLGGRYGQHWLAQPYATALDYHEEAHFHLTPLSGAARPVLAGHLPLQERPQAYVHLPTASLQLVYDMRLSLPDDCREVSLLHADEALEEQQLVARLDTASPELYLLPVEPAEDGLFTLQNGRLHACPSDGLWLSEGFAAQEGWVVTEERVRLAEWADARRETGCKRYARNAAGRPSGSAHTEDYGR